MERIRVGNIRRAAQVRVSIAQQHARNRVLEAIRHKANRLNEFADAIENGRSLEQYKLNEIARDIRYDARLCPNNRAVANALALMSLQYLPVGSAVSIPIHHHFEGGEARDYQIVIEFENPPE